MKRTFLSIKFMVLFLIVSLFFSVSMTTVGASSTTKLYIDPSKVEHWTPAFGETFTINVKIANVSDLIFFEFKLYWNTTLLDLIEVTIQPFLNPPATIYRNEINETLGRYWLFIYSAGPPKNGSGALATLSFNITYEPLWPGNVTSTLDLADTILGNSSGDPITHEVYDGEYSCYSTPPLSITTMTDGPWYWLIEGIHIYGNLTLGGSPVQDGIVALEVDDPQNGIITIRSLLTGTPPASQIIEIVDVIPCDNWGNPKNNFYIGYPAYFNVTVKNNDIKSQRVLIAINLYDAENRPFGWDAFEGPVAAGATQYTILEVLIPDTASVGEARVYGNALTGWPKDGGTAYCPEKNATFNNVNSATGATTSKLQSSSSPEGTYDLTFNPPSNGKPGNYTIYANSEYTIHAINRTQKATNIATFEVKVPDINNDNTVDIFDLVIIGIAYGSVPEDPNWDPRADVNQDNTVDLFDLVIVAIHYGWTDP